MKLLDLFCGAGGCSVGYHQAGFTKIVGVDIEPQPRYPFEFIQADVMSLDIGFLRKFDLIHASPPCERYSKSTLQWRQLGYEYPDLVAPVRQMLAESGRPYVIENVPGAPLINPIRMNGSKFRMCIHRPRMFEIHGFDTEFSLQPPDPKPLKMGRPPREGDVLQPVGHFSGVDYAKREMGIDWMTQKELAQAIPPAYTKWIGEQMLQAVTV